MNLPNTATVDDPRRDRPASASASAGAVSWASIFAGAAGAAALSLILLMLGTGLGLSSVSPWAHAGINRTAFGVSTILWVTFTQLVASGMGAMTNSGLQAVASVVVADASTSEGPQAYFIDTLFRRDGDALKTAASPAMPAPLSEVSRIFMAPLQTGTLPPQDVRYVGQLVAQRTGLPQAEAEKRVTDTYARAQTHLRDAQTAMTQAADTARKTSAYVSLWLFISLLSGAFAASLAATLGGRQRDT